VTLIFDPYGAWAGYALFKKDSPLRHGGKKEKKQKQKNLKTKKEKTGFVH
jgi:hypothetical protein